MQSDYIKDDFYKLNENSKTIELALAVLTLAIERNNKKLIVMGLGIANCVHYSVITKDLWDKLNPLTIECKAILEDTTAKRLEMPFPNE